MKYTLFFSEDALRDIEESYKWYEEQKHGLGEDFLDSIYSGADKIRTNPDLYQFQGKTLNDSVIKSPVYRNCEK
jgi:toxin ParE1/3/4